MKTLSQLREKCWPGYEKKGMKTLFGKRYPNCVKKESVNEANAAAIAAATAIAKKKSGNYDKEGMRKTPYKNPDAPNVKSNEQRRKEMNENFAGDRPQQVAGSAQATLTDKPNKEPMKTYKQLKNITELSTELLHRYKEKAAADASKADKAGNFERGNKRFSGVVKATNKQFANFKKKGFSEAKDDKREYDYEGEMVKSDLRSIIANANRLTDMLDDDDNLPEWCQNKITLAEDYISTVANYMTAEMNEEVEQLDEKNVPTNPGLWSRAKALARSKFDVYPCVPLDSLAICKNGPVSHDELNVGDEILTYNMKEDILEWKPISHKHYYENAPLIEIGKPTGFSIRCTPNHKWVISKDDENELIEAKDLNTHMKLLMCAKLKNDSTLLIENWSKKDNWIEKVLSMNEKEREIFLASSVVYDGWDKGVSFKIKGRHTFGFVQKEYDHLWASLLAAYLNGYYVNSREKTEEMTSASYIRNKRFHNTQNLYKKDAGFEDVWCPTTENETWVMIQNGLITITGNSAYANGWASKWYKSKGGGWRSVSEEVEQIDENAMHGTVYLHKYHEGSSEDSYGEVGKNHTQHAYKVYHKKPGEKPKLIGDTENNVHNETKKTAHAVARNHEMEYDHKSHNDAVRHVMDAAGVHSATPVRYIKDKKQMNEEVEQIDELSKSTLASYATKAADQARVKKDAAVGYVRMNKGRGSSGEIKKSAEGDKRIEGVKGAIKRLAKEEVEQIDEISAKTAMNYLHKTYDTKGYKDHSPQTQKGIQRATRKVSQDAMQKNYEKSYKAGLSTEETKPPFEGGTKPKDKVIAGKYGKAYSTARHLARVAMQKQVEKMKKAPMKEETRKAAIVKDIMKKKKTASEDAFQKDPELSNTLTKL